MKKFKNQLNIIFKFPNNTHNSVQEEIKEFYSYRPKYFLYTQFKNPQRLFKDKINIDIVNTESMWHQIFSQTNLEKIDVKNFKLDATDEKLCFMRLNYAKKRFFNLLKIKTKIIDSNVYITLDKKTMPNVIKFGRMMKEYRDLLVIANFGLIHAMLNRYGFGRNSNYRNYQNELISDALLALINSVDLFDVNRGFKFSTYACSSILSAYGRCAKKIKIRNDKEIKTETFSSDFGDDGGSVINNVTKTESIQILHKALQSNLLIENEKKVIKGRYFDYQTLEYIGEQIGVSKERVRQIQNEALKKLKEHFDNEAILN